MDAIVVGIDVSKDRLDVHVRPSGEAFAVEPRRGGARGAGRAAAGAVAAADRGGGGDRRLRDGRGGEPGGGGAARRWWSTRRRSAPSPRRSGKRAKTDPIDAAVIAHFAEATKPAVRPLPDAATQHARRSRRPPAADHPDDRGREAAREARRQPRCSKSIARLLKALQTELSAVDQRHRRRRPRLAGLAREGGPARLRPRRRADHRPHPDRRAARARHASTAARSPALAGLAPWTRQSGQWQRQELHRRRPRQLSAPPSSWAPSSPTGTTPSSRPSISASSTPASPKWSPSSPSPESSSPSSTPSSGTKYQWQPA